MKKVAKRVVASFEDGGWWLSTCFDRGGSDDVEWEGDLPSPGQGVDLDDSIRVRDALFSYLRKKYGGTVSYDRDTIFEVKNA